MMVRLYLLRRMIVAIFISLICHILCFNSIEFTFGENVDRKSSEFSRVFFLGPILKETDYYSHSTKAGDGSPPLRGEFLAALKAESSPIYELGSDFKKPSLVNLTDNKIAYFESPTVQKTKRAESSIVFYPPMPYRFLLYFKDRQTAHMEVAFYISPKGKVKGIKRKISSGNPEVDLLIMRNLTHFLNLCKSNFTFDSWQAVKIDLSP